MKEDALYNAWKKYIGLGVPMTKEGQLDAAKFQDEIGEWIADAINKKLEHEKTENKETKYNLIYITDIILFFIFAKILLNLIKHSYKDRLITHPNLLLDTSLI